MKLESRKEAVLLRKKGFSFNEISEKLKISKSTASLWLRDVKLTKTAKIRIARLGVSGRRKGVETNKKIYEAEDDLIKSNIEKDFANFIFSKMDFRIACALLYWGEGTKHKTNSSVSFINADPEMIRYFLRVFRNSFKLNEKKFRCLIHLHEYHDEGEQLKFWSGVTNIPIEQFNRSYLKKNTGKNKKENYPGCLSVRYGDSRIYREIMFIIKRLIKG